MIIRKATSCHGCRVNVAALDVIESVVKVNFSSRSSIYALISCSAEAYSRTALVHVSKVTNSVQWFQNLRCAYRCSSGCLNFIQVLLTLNNRYCCDGVRNDSFSCTHGQFFPPSEIQRWYLSLDSGSKVAKNASVLVGSSSNLLLLGNRCHPEVFTNNKSMCMLLNYVLWLVSWLLLSHSSILKFWVMLSSLTFNCVMCVERKFECVKSKTVPSCWFYPALFRKPSRMCSN